MPSTPTPAGIVEAVARIINPFAWSRTRTNGPAKDAAQRNALRTATAAITATLLAVREATPEMREAGGGTALDMDEDIGRAVAGHCWQRMIDTLLATIKDQNHVG